MRKLIVIVFVISGLVSKAQMYISPEIGYSSKQAMQASLQAGYEFKNVVAEGDLRFNCNRRDPALFGLRAGIELPVGRLSLTPLASTYFKMVSNDKKALNGFVYGYGLRVQLHNHVTFQVSQVDKTFYVGVGFKSL